MPEDKLWLSRTILLSTMLIEKLLTIQLILQTHGIVVLRNFLQYKDLLDEVKNLLETENKRVIRECLIIKFMPV